MVIRREEEKDYAAVENLIRDAFWNVNAPGAAEHFLAHQMRGHKDFVPELALVAEENGKIVGCILYTVSSLTAQDGEIRSCLSFGPIAVHPEYQRRGIGKALMAQSFQRAGELGYESVVIFGHPSNYVSSGFVSCLRCNVCLGDGYFPTALLVKPLTEHAFDGRRWSYQESEACEFDPADAEEYDRGFPDKEKKVLPCQEEFFIYSHSSLHE